MASACTAVGSAKRLAAARATRASSPRAVKSMPREPRSALGAGGAHCASVSAVRPPAPLRTDAMADLATLSEHARGLHGVPAQCVPCRPKNTAPRCARGPFRDPPHPPACSPPLRRAPARTPSRLGDPTPGDTIHSTAYVSHSHVTHSPRVPPLLCRLSPALYIWYSPTATSCACTASSSPGPSLPARWDPHGASLGQPQRGAGRHAAACRVGVENTLLAVLSALLLTLPLA
jgi:hypothetical protein